MQESGVVLGQVCPECGIEDAVPIVDGMPLPSDALAEERGLVVLLGCMISGDEPAFHCRGCGHDFGDEDAPTADERELAGLLAVRYEDVVRALGTGWRTVGAEAGRTWFVSGVPAQVAVGVGDGSVIVAPADVDRDAAAYGDGGRTFSRDDLLTLPDWLATTADEYARTRRRSFRWCPTCREPRAPEDFTGYRGVCRDCGARHHGLER